VLRPVALAGTRVDSLPGAPPPSPGQRADARPVLALRPWRVTRRRRRRRGWPWPEARFRPLPARRDRGAIREPQTVRSWCRVPTGAIRHRRACERSDEISGRLGGGSGLRASRGRVHSRPRIAARRAGAGWWRCGRTVRAARRGCGGWPPGAAGAFRARVAPAGPASRCSAPARRGCARWRCSSGARSEAQRPVTTGRRPEAADSARRGLPPVGRLR